MLHNELEIQKIEVLLDMQAKKLQAEIVSLKDELSRVKEDLRKEIKAVRQDPTHQRVGEQHIQMYSDVPQRSQPAPHQPVYASGNGQQPEAPRAADKPIDRNGVAPADVSVEKIFYMGNR